MVGGICGALVLNLAAKELETGDRLQLAMRHERRPGERQQHDQQCSKKPHA